MNEPPPRSLQPLDYGTRQKPGIPRGLRWLTIVLTGIFGFLIIMYFKPHLGESRVTPSQARCRSNLFDIASALRQYCGNHNGEYPDSFQSLMLAGQVPA